VGFREMNGIMTRVVLSLGGSILFPTLEENRLAGYLPVLRRLAEKMQIYIVVGGGGEARRYIRVARNAGVDEATCDEIGIRVTRLNALLLVSALGGSAYPEVAESQTGAIAAGAATGKIVVMGGITPAQTTDAVAAVLAEMANADLLVNVTSIDGIYSADPKKDPDAIRFESLTADELMKIVSGDSLSAGSNTVMDMVAVKVVQRSGIPMVVVDGREPANLAMALLEGRLKGTVVTRDGKSPLPLR
jgi:uridylate kinase